MAPSHATDTPPDWGFDATFEGTRRSQARLGLQLTPAERLEWLEAMLEEFPEAAAGTRALQLRRQPQPGPEQTPTPDQSRLGT